MNVGEVHRLIVENATTITLDKPLDELLKKIVEDPRTRHVYVIDNKNILMGSVRLNSVLEYLFAMTSMPYRERPGAARLRRAYRCEVCEGYNEYEAGFCPVRHVR